MGSCFSCLRGDDSSASATPQQAQIGSTTHLHPSAPHVLGRPSTSSTTRSPTSGIGVSTSPRQTLLSEHYNRPLRSHDPSTRRRNHHRRFSGTPSNNDQQQRRRSPRKWTRRQLERERTAFFDTRVTGRAEIWAALRVALDLMPTDLPTAQGILDAAGITLPTGDVVDGCYDQQGALYRIPSWMVMNPEEMAEDSDDDEGDDDQDEEGSGEKEEDEFEEQLRRESKGKSILVGSDEMIKVRVRLSDRGNGDVTVELGKSEKIAVLIRRVMLKSGLSRPTRLKIAYLGHLLKEHETLSAQGWHEGHVLNGLVFSPPGTSSQSRPQLQSSFPSNSSAPIKGSGSDIDSDSEPGTNAAATPSRTATQQLLRPTLGTTADAESSRTIVAASGSGSSSRDAQEHENRHGAR